jgi:hypothetical protein
MNIDELEATLPNGLHDALICSYTFSEEERRVEVGIEVDMGDYRSRYVKARLEFLDVSRWEPDAPHTVSMAPVAAGLRIDTCEEDPKAPLSVPAGGFAGRFFVSEWNAFIHFVASDVRLLWLEAN